MDWISEDGPGLGGFCPHVQYLSLLALWPLGSWGDSSHPSWFHPCSVSCLHCSLEEGLGSWVVSCRWPSPQMACVPTMMNCRDKHRSLGGVVKYGSKCPMPNLLTIADITNQFFFNEAFYLSLAFLSAQNSRQAVPVTCLFHLGWSLICPVLA